MPSKLDDFIGQTAIKDLIRGKIQFAGANAVAFPHLLLCGERESGRKQFAAAIADELGVPLTVYSSESLEKRLDLSGQLTNVTPRQFVTITDVDALRQPVLEVLLSALSFRIDILIGAGPGARTHSIVIPSFTFVGTTSKPWIVDQRLRRWCIACEFAPYSREEVAGVVRQIAAEKGIPLIPEAASDIADQCSYRPGDAAMLLQKIASHFRFSQSDRIDQSRLREILEYLGPGSLCPPSLTLAERVQTMTGIEFEHWVADLFRQAGFHVELTQVTGDHGVDLWATVGSDLVAVQCKRWEGTVGEPVIRDLYGAMTAAKAKVGFIVTTATFTAQAQQFAVEKALSLIDLDRLMQFAKSPKLLREIVMYG